jgi:hypothetical protein
MRFWFAGFGLILGLSSAVTGQWTAVRLHPESALGSEVLAVGAGRQGGYGFFPGFYEPPIIWRGSSSAWTPYSTVSGIVGTVYGIWGEVEVGIDDSWASLWRGTPESRVSLHPAGVSGLSYAYAACGNMQAGAVGNNSNAAVWYGSAASYVNLHPAGAVSSEAFATDGVLQGGYVVWPSTPGPVFHAAIWSGTAQSVVDLNPTGASQAVSSYVRGMAPGIQVGEARRFGQNVHAAVWHGTAASWVDLHPSTNAGGSTIWGTTGTVHVGEYAEVGFMQAAVNFGTPDSWLSLHQYLPAGYDGFSRATSVYQEENTLYVGGWADNSLGQREAFLWIGTIPAPGAGTVVLIGIGLAARRHRRAERGVRQGEQAQA